MGFWLLLTAGCALPPAVEPAPTDAVDALAKGPTVPGIQSLPIRVGVEFLPPTRPREAPVAYVHGGLSWSQFGEAFSAPSVIATPDHPSRFSRESELPPEASGTVTMPWNFDKAERNNIEDPFERVSVHLMQELMGDDMRRFRREIGTTALEGRHMDLSYLELPNYMDEWENDYDEMFFGTRGRRFIRRPIRKAIKSFSLFQNIDMAIESIKGDLPMSGDYESEGVEEGRSSRLSLGRLTARLRSNFDDPLELAYKNSGFRLGSSQARLRCGYSSEIAESFFVSLNSEYNYDSDHLGLRADLRYEFDERTSAHFSAGDQLSFLMSPNYYSLMEDDGLQDSSHGVIFYVEHLF